jgi:hypothetical protein
MDLIGLIVFGMLSMLTATVSLVAKIIISARLRHAESD